MVVIPVLVGALLIVFDVFLQRQSPALSGKFTISSQEHAVPQRVLERDFYERLAHSGSRPESVTCGDDLAAGRGSTARCTAQFKRNWKSGTPFAVSTSSGWLADRADYAVTQVDGRTVEFAITPGLSLHILENALAQDLVTAGYLKCPDEGITGIAGTTITCLANYGYPDGPCSDPIFDENGRESPVLRRCTLLIGVQHVSGLSLDLKILKVTPPA